jgi:galactitol PTS system EIIA component
MTIRIFATEDINDISTYEDAIILAGEKLKKADVIRKGFTQACIDREKEFPTGLKLKNNLGIAIPHGNPKLVIDSSISFLRLNKPVNFGLMEDASKKVSCKFLFNLALTNGTEHLNTLRQLMKLFQSEKFLSGITNLPISDLELFLLDSIKHN